MTSRKQPDHTRQVKKGMEGLLQGETPVPTPAEKYTGVTGANQDQARVRAQAWGSGWVPACTLSRWLVGTNREKLGEVGGN